MYNSRFYQLSEILNTLLSLPQLQTYLDAAHLNNPVARCLLGKINLSRSHHIFCFRLELKE